MKLTFQRQLTLTIIIKLLFNLLTTALKHWVYASIGSCLCGLLWILHPVLIDSSTPTRRDLNLIRLVGVLLILYGIFSRQYFY